MYYLSGLPRSIISNNALNELYSLFNETTSFFSKKECAYPYNVKVRKDGTSVLEYSLAGFTKDEISLEVKDEKLIVKAKAEKEEPDESVTNVYTGIAKRSMVHSVPVDLKYHDLKNIKAEFENGILVIEIPQSQESKEANFKVEIN